MKASFQNPASGRFVSAVKGLTALGLFLGLAPLLCGLVFEPAGGLATRPEEAMDWCLNGAPGKLSKSSSFLSPQEMERAWVDWGDSHGFSRLSGTPLAASGLDYFSLVPAEATQVRSLAFFKPGQTDWLVLYGMPAEPGCHSLRLQFDLPPGGGAGSDPSYLPLPQPRLRLSSLLVRAGAGSTPGFYRYRLSRGTASAQAWMRPQLLGRGFKIGMDASGPRGRSVWQCRWKSRSCLLEFEPEGGGSLLNVCTDLPPEPKPAWPLSSR